MRQGHIMERMILVVYLIMAIGSTGKPTTVWAQDSTFFDFRLEDQFKREYTDDQFRGRVVVVIGSDKEGSQYNELWTKAILDSIEDRSEFDKIALLGVADLRGVPFFLKGYVRGRFPEDRDKWALLDWKGLFAEAYDFVEEESNILVFDTQGRLVYRTNGTEPHKQVLQKIITAIFNAK